MTGMGVVRRVAVVCVLVAGVFMAAGCLSDELYSTTEMPKDQAAQLVDETFARVRVPEGFTPVAVTVGVTTWGSQARTVKAAFTASRTAFDAFLAGIRTEEDPVWMMDTSCPPHGGAATESAVMQAPDRLLDDWYDRGTFRRCEPIESWRISITEFRDTARSAGGIHLQVNENASRDDEVTVLISTTIA